MQLTRINYHAIRTNDDISCYIYSNYMVRIASIYINCRRSITVKIFTSTESEALYVRWG